VFSSGKNKKKMYKKINSILVPIDLSDYSMNTLEVAIQIAKKNNSKITVAHIIDITVSPIESIENSFEQHWPLDYLEEKYHFLLDGLKNEVKGKYGFTIDVILKKGLIASSIVGIARDIYADLIVIGTHGTGSRTFFLGLNAYCIVKQATCSILTIPEIKDYGAFTKILFPVQAVNGVLEKYDFLKMILQKSDVVVEIPGLINASGGTNINSLNETITFLGNKLAEEDSEFNYSIHDIVQSFNDSRDDIKIKLITIEDEHINSIEDWTPILSPKKVKNFSKIPIFSITH